VTHKFANVALGLFQAGDVKATTGAGHTDPLAAGLLGD
jgi:hypothetical protein